MTARTETINLMNQLSRRSINISFDDANTLRRAQIALHRWAEMECGDGNDHAFWSIERDENTGKPYFVTYPHTGQPRRRPIADKERGALKRVADTCKRNGLHFFHQTDPRGCSLYVSNEPINDSNYTNGIAA